MPDHYFTNQPDSAHDERELEFEYKGSTLIFLTDAGTFSRGRVDPGSELLLRAIPEVRGSCADIGCGWGAIGLSAAKANPLSEWLLIDINERSASLARQNAARNEVGNIRIETGDGLGGIRGHFSLIVTNPPIRAGKETVYRFFKQAWERLLPGGAFLAVIRKQQGAPSAKKRLEELFGNCAAVARESGYHVLKSIKEE